MTIAVKAHSHGEVFVYKPKVLFNIGTAGFDVNETIEF